MPLTVKEMLEAGNAVVPKLAPAEAVERIRRENVLGVDLRDAAEVQKTGKIKGAVNVPRGLLEFRADPDSPTHDKAFSRDKTVLLHCASGGRATLAGKTLKDMGYDRVYNVGGFKDLAEAGAETEPV